MQASNNFWRDVHENYVRSRDEERYFGVKKNGSTLILRDASVILFLRRKDDTNKMLVYVRHSSRISRSKLN